MPLPPEPDERPAPHRQLPDRTQTVDSDGNIRNDIPLERLEHQEWQLEQSIRRLHQEARQTITDAEAEQVELDAVRLMIAAAKAGRR